MRRYKEMDEEQLTEEDPVGRRESDIETDDVWEACPSCGRQQKKAVMVRSEDDEYLCQECFRKEFYESCDSEDDTTVPLSKVREKNQSELLFPHLESLMKSDKMRSKFYKVSTCGPISKRPVVCPMRGCGRHVAVLAFDGHFKYEHGEVPVMATHLDSRTSLHFYPQDLELDPRVPVAHPACSAPAVHCAMLLNVVDVDDVTRRTPSFAPDSPHRNSPLTFVLLAANVPPASSAPRRTSGGGGDHPSADELLPRLSRRCRRQHPDELVLVWLASNLATALSYTVAASAQGSGARVKYYGPVVPLPGAGAEGGCGGDPVEMCGCGRGLVLPAFQHLAMTDGGSRPLVLDVVVHPAED